MDEETRTRKLLWLSAVQKVKRLKEEQKQRDFKMNIDTKDYICMCEALDGTLETKFDLPVNCTAKENLHEQEIGCSNEVTDAHIRRCGPDKAGARLCSNHISRLKAHIACPLCGVFCGHGTVLMCRPEGQNKFHLFHEHCYDKSPDKRCPHCGTHEEPYKIKLTLSSSRLPELFLKAAVRMNRADSYRAPKPLPPPTINHTLPNGTTITSEGLPNCLEEDFQKIIDGQEGDGPSKHTTRNMALPTKTGDNIKLLQLLSLGGSIHNKYPEAKGGNLLHLAAAYGHVTTTHILLQAGLPINSLDNLSRTPLMVACLENKFEVVQYLLHAGADTSLKDDEDMTCLHLAAKHGSLTSVQAILSQITVPKSFIDSLDMGRWTPLVWACENKHLEVVKYLLESGANQYILDSDGNISIHWGARSGSIGTCELLLQHATDPNTVNAVNTQLDSPIHIALRFEFIDCALFFMIRQAKMDLRNGEGLTAEEMGKLSKNANIRRIFRMSDIMKEVLLNVNTDKVEKVISGDHSNGRENVAIQVVNVVDDAKDPRDYVYVTKNCLTQFIKIDRRITSLKHCDCADNCASDKCACGTMSQRRWYDADGRLDDKYFKSTETKDHIQISIYECNDMCSCHSIKCKNRVVQKGVTATLQIFRTRAMGWGVRAGGKILKGTFVCEYTGEIVTDKVAESREDTYLFDTGTETTDNKLCIDANKYGNVARFINHSCSPNLVTVRVYVDHQDQRMPRMALFASRDIQKDEELGFDYGVSFWAIKGKRFTCQCRSENCRFSKTKIYNSIAEYFERIGKKIPSDFPDPSMENGKSAKRSKPSGGDSEKDDASSDLDTKDYRSKKISKTS